MAKLLEAVVVSNKMMKTIVVKIDRTFRHHKYKKVITRHKTLKVHSEDPTIQEGDVVIIRETAPISKDKHFILVKKIESAEVLPELKREKIELKVEKAKEEAKIQEAPVEVKKPEEKTVKVAKAAPRKKARAAAKPKTV